MVLKSGVHQLSLVVSPIIYKVFAPSQVGFRWIFKSSKVSSLSSGSIFIPYSAYSLIYRVGKSEKIYSNCPLSLLSTHTAVHLPSIIQLSKCDELVVKNHHDVFVDFTSIYTITELKIRK